MLFFAFFFFCFTDNFFCPARLHWISIFGWLMINWTICLYFYWNKNSVDSLFLVVFQAIFLSFTASDYSNRSLSREVCVCILFLENATIWWRNGDNETRLIDCYFQLQTKFIRWLGKEKKNKEKETNKQEQVNPKFRHFLFFLSS